MYIKRMKDGECIFIRRDDGDGRFTDIPPSEENRFYQEYLEWVAEGNVAEEVNE